LTSAVTALQIVGLVLVVVSAVGLTFSAWRPRRNLSLRGRILVAAVAVGLLVNAVLVLL